jgi:hypothetical protein
MSGDLSDAVFMVKSSEVREEIIRELYGESLVRPSEIIDVVQSRTGTSKANFYKNLKALLGDSEDVQLVEKMDGSGRTTLYQLTGRGETVAEELDLDLADADDEAASTDDATAPGLPQTKEEARQMLRDSPLTLEEIAELLEEVEQVRQWSE